MSKRAAAMLCCLGACTPSPGGPDASVTKEPERWSVRDGFVRDIDGRAVILRGVNLSQAQKHAPYLDFHQAADYARIRDDWGMNSVRFLIEWAAVEPQPDVYDDAYLAEVRRRLDWAREARLLVVLDMHQDVYGEGFSVGNGAPRWTCDESYYAAFSPTDPWFLNYLDENVVACFDQLWGDQALQDHYARAWRHVAEQLGDHEAVIGFEVMNEPFLGSFEIDVFEPAALQGFYEAVVPAVRAAAPHWVAFLEPSSMRNLGNTTRLARFPFANVVYAPHSYDPSAEQGEGFDPARRAHIVETVAEMAQEARALEAALWIGEYGGNADHAGIADYMDAQYDAAAAVLAGSMYWQYGRDESYGLLRTDGSAKAVLLDVLARPFPERVAGAPAAWQLDETTRTFTLRYLAAAIGGETVVSLPRRFYPGGHRVVCDGCTYEDVTAGIVVVAQQAEVEVTVAPR